jgi:hypothetical protein
MTKINPMSTQPIPVESTQTSASATQPQVVSFEQRLSNNWEYAMSQGSLFFEGKGDVKEALRKITQRLNDLDIPYAVVGGMALNFYGYRRFTEDVDILVTKEGLKKIHQELDGKGFIRPFEKSKNLREAETKVKIEFLLTGDYPGDGKPKEIAFPDPSHVSEFSHGIKFLKLPTLITLKLASGLTGQDRGKDLTDVEELIKILQLPETFADQLHSSVQAAFRSIWHKLHGVTKRYVTIWRNKWLTAGAKSLEDMIQMLQNSSKTLEAMFNDGVTLDQQGGTGDDYAYLVTTDPKVAEKYDMHPEDEIFDDEASDK